MRRPSSIEPYSPPESIAIHPALKAALGNLDVQLEEELTRYRRQRRLQPDRGRQKPSYQLILDKSLSPLKAWGRTRRTEAEVQLPPVTKAATPNLATPGETPPAPAPTHSAASTTASDDLWQTQPPQPTATPHNQTVLQSVAAQFAPQPIPLAEGAVPPTAPSAGGITAYADQTDLSAFAPSTTLQKLVQPDADPSDPEGYLESSEELLRSIAEEEAELRAEPHPDRLLDTLLTPLGIGSMLLMLLSSATLGYVMMNPGSLGFLAKQSPTPDRSIEAESQGVTVPTIPIDEPIPSPNLAAEEFVDLNLNSLSTIPGRSNRSAPAASPKPKANSTSSSSTAAPANAAPPVQAAPQVMSVAPSQPVENLPEVVVPAEPAYSDPEPSYSDPEPDYVPPEPEAEVSAAPSAAPAPAGESPSSEAEPPGSQPYYHVVTDFQGDPSLEQAREAVPDAYVRNFDDGAQVQLGAFSDAAKAEELIEQLEQQGIQAEIRQP